MGNKRVNKDLHELAAKLPRIWGQTKEKGYYSGKELEELGYEKDKNGIPLISDQHYYIELPVEIACNHYRRMKKAYKKHGMKGVNNYLTNLDRVVTPQVKSQYDEI